MKKAFQISICILVALLLAPHAYGQAALTYTTLSAAITTTGQQTIVLGSATGITERRTKLYIDHEAMDVTTANGTAINVVRGAAGTRAATHPAGSIVWISPTGNYFATTDRFGSCTATSEFVLPVINITNGKHFDCIGSLWVEAPRVNVASFATANFRAMRQEVTVNYAGSVTTGNNNVTAIRGNANLGASATLTAGYLYGSQGKLTVAGTLNGTAWVSGLMGQTDISAGTLTAGSHLTPIWSDAGATGPAVTCSFCSSLVLTNTTSTTFGSLIYGYTKASYVFDFTGNGTAFALSTSGTSAGNCAQTGGIVAAKAMPVKIDGTDYWIPLCTAL